MIKLSFIVPVYNVETYLRKCVDSLIHQDFSNYEILLVDDGSTDGSGAICDELSVSFSDDQLALRVIHLGNGGLSLARNAGLKEAKGEYIMFVDSDDYIEPNVLGGLMEQVERENLDVLHFDYQNVRLVTIEGMKKSFEQERDKNEFGNEREYEVFQPYKYPHPIDTRTDVVTGECYLNERMGYGCYACHFIIKRELVDKFTPGIHFEDTEWLPRMMLSAKRVNSSSEVVYNYFWREGSITQTQGNTQKIRKNLEDQMTIIAQYNSYITKHPHCSWLYQMRSTMVVSVIANVAQFLYSERKTYLTRLRILNVYPLTMESKQGKTYLRKARFINISPRLLVELLHLKNSK